MDKVIRDGKVAVLYSPGHGAGWYTWNTDRPEILFDPGLVGLVEKEDTEQMRIYAELKWPDCYTGGLEGLQIEWVPEGARFIVHEYDGHESVDTIESIAWITA